MKKLKLQYDSETDIPDGFAELYEERDGKFHFGGVEGMKTQKDIDGLKAAADKERKLRVEMQDKLKKFEKLADKDPEELLKALDEVEDLRAQLEEHGTGAAGGKGKDAAGEKERIDAAVARAVAKVQRELDKEKTEHAKTKGEKEAEATRVSALDGRIKTSAIQAALVKVAGDQKIKATALGDVLLHAHLFEVETDEDGEVTGVKTRDKVGVTPGIDPASWLADRKGDKPHWWEESVGGGAGGSGARGAGGENPFRKEQFNVTKAAKLMSTEPAKADALARSAGFKNADAAVAAMAKT